eukprot:CAMPEP_0118666680 /NCGR_PEP_ID=MMETSP0785-20121206/19352_1 /TAXON_ID=91992 /ORGANISM="Bolidomonas pacifica, Strain CCMP 1866" /LENGTH=76 /DNA_ID=CAMNT_0006561023 /DNA_START=134 /DNA_END=364 /DNA_ORIENTATION=+
MQPMMNPLKESHKVVSGSRVPAPEPLALPATPSVIPRLVRTHTPETEVLARFLMDLGKSSQSKVASPRGGGGWLVM